MKDSHSRLKMPCCSNKDGTYDRQMRGVCFGVSVDGTGTDEAALLVCRSDEAESSIGL